MRRDQEPFDVLKAVLKELAATDAPEVLAEARIAARGRAKTLIEDRLVDELLRAAGALRERPREQAAASEPLRAPKREPPPAGYKRESARGGDAWWTYCVLPAADGAAVAPELQGIEPGTTVEVVAEGDLAALVSRVPLAEYDDDRLREHLEDIEWVERTARAHEAVLERALADATIVPLRLCTLYRDQEGVRRLLRDQRGELIGSLEAVAACAEWGVKLFSTTATAAPDEASVETTSGAEYLASRQRARARANQASELRAQAAEEVYERLLVVAREGRCNPPQRPEAHGRDAEMLLNAALLVERDRSEELRDAVAAARELWEPRGYQIEVTGPWPPYNFVASSAGVVP
jgi:hypothetical protein